MAAAVSHPELYDALREAGASEPRARAAEQTTLPAAQAAAKSEVKEQVGKEIRSVDLTVTKIWTAVTIISGLAIANFFFAVTGLIFAYGATESSRSNREAISENRVVIQANALAIAENRAAIEANAQAIAENRAAIQVNSEKLDEIIRLLRIAQAK